MKKIESNSLQASALVDAHFPNYNKEELLGMLDNKLEAKGLTYLTKLSFKWFYYVMFVFTRNKQPEIKDFHIDIMDKLTALAHGTLDKNLMLLLPPGFGKTLMMQMFVAWCFVRNKNYSFIYETHSRELSRDRSGEIKSLLESYYATRLYGLRLVRDVQSKTAWRVDGSSERTGMFATSIEGAITGRDAGNPNIVDEEGLVGKVGQVLNFNGGLLLDDPMNATDVNSETLRTRVIDSYTNAIESRLRSYGNSKARVIMGVQRLHINDLAGWLLENQPEKWEVLKVPALDNNERSIWEDKISTESLLKMRSMESMREIYYAQYQQSPVVPSGNVIDVSWFKYHDGNFWDVHSKIRRAFITCDTAIGTKVANDFTVFCLWFVLDTGLYLIDMERGKWGGSSLIKQVKDFWDKHDREPTGHKKTHAHEGLYLDAFCIEEAVSGISVIQHLKEKGGEGYIPVIPLKADKDKLTRVQEATPFIESGWVFLPNNRPDIKSLVLAECVAFTRDDTHEHDDIVDCLAYAVRQGLFKSRYAFKLGYEA